MTFDDIVGVCASDLTVPAAGDHGHRRRCTSRCAGYRVWPASIGFDAKFGVTSVLGVQAQLDTLERVRIGVAVEADRAIAAILNFAGVAR